MRQAELSRNTKETQVKLALCIDEEKGSDIKTSHGFFNHMLEAFAKHGRMSLKVDAGGDDTGPHHLIEDVGIVLGQALAQCAGDRKGIERFASVCLPMDETMVEVAVDIGGRGYLKFEAPPLKDVETGLSMSLINDFFYAVAINGSFNLHITINDGDNFHHKVEGAFKALGVCLRKALLVSGTSDVSTKGKPTP